MKQENAALALFNCMLGCDLKSNSTEIPDILGTVTITVDFNQLRKFIAKFKSSQ
jgi:hypothetical protein